jgi:type II secretory pathway component PulF
VTRTNRLASEIAASPLPSEMEIAAFLQTLGEMLLGEYHYPRALETLRDRVANRRLAALADHLQHAVGSGATPSELLASFEHVELAFAAAVVADGESRGDLAMGFVEAAAAIHERAGRARGFRSFD